MSDSPSPPPRVGAAGKRSVKTSNGSSVIGRKTISVSKRDTSNQSKKSVATTGASFSAIDWKMNISRLGMKLNIDNDGGRDQFAMVSSSDLAPKVPQQPIPSPVKSVDSGPTNFTIEMEKYFAKDFDVESYKSKKAAKSEVSNPQMTQTRQAREPSPQLQQPHKPQQLSPSRSSRYSPSLVSEHSSHRGSAAFLDEGIEDSENDIDESQTPASVIHHRLASPSDSSTFAPNCPEPVMPRQTLPTYEQLLSEMEELKEENDFLRGQNDELRVELDSMLKEEERVNRENEKVTRENKALKEELKNGSEALTEELRNENKVLEEELRNEKKVLKEQLRNGKKAIKEELKSEFKVLKRSEENLRSEIKALKRTEEKLRRNEENLRNENQDLRLVAQNAARSALAYNDRQSDALALLEKEKKVSEQLEKELNEVKAFSTRVEKVLMYEWGKQECGPRKRPDGTWGMGYRYGPPKDQIDPVLEAERRERESMGHEKRVKGGRGPRGSRS